MIPNSIGQAGFYLQHRLGLFLLGVSFILLIFELVRRGHLKERYALLWLAAGGAALVVGVFPRLIIWLAALLEFQYLTVLFAFSAAFFIALLLAFTVIISKLSERSRTLAQEVAILRQRLEAIESDPRNAKAPPRA